MAATLDIISGGRLELGIGAGWNEEESGAYGMELGTPAERSDRFEEACEVIVGLLTQETTTFDGKYYQLKRRPLRTEGRRSSRTRRSPSAAAARSGPCARRRSSRSTGTSSAAHRRSSPASGTSCTSTARTWAATRARSRCPATSGMEGTPQQAAEAAAALGEQGLDLAIVILPTPLDPAVLAPLADALAPLA